MIEEAKAFWDAISGKVKALIQSETSNAMRVARFNVTTAPNGSVMGVTQPYGNTELLLPYSQEVAGASVGDTVLVAWWGSMSNGRVYYFSKGYDGGAGGGGASTNAIASITFPAAASWTDSGNGWWTAVPTIASATISAESKIDLQPTATQFLAIQNAGVQDLYVENDNAALTAYAVGNPPASAITMQCSISGTNAPQPPVNPSIDMIYPVGSIYMSVNSVNPANVIGGTWERIKDTFLLAAGDSYSAGSSGGSEKHTHEYGIQYGMYYTATVIENDSNAGALSYDQAGNISIGAKESMGAISSSHPSATGTATGSFNHERATGNTSYTSNMPPYLAVYVWQRTA